MLQPRLTSAALAILLSTCLALPAVAEIISLSGSASATVAEVGVVDEPEQDEATDSYPDTVDELPVQVVAQLLALDGEALGYAAAQLADPLSSTGTNPQELAIHLNLTSGVGAAAYTGEATVEELRGVRLLPEEVDAVDGATVSLTGKLFLDGVLVIFADPDITDISDAGLTVEVTIVQETGTGESLQSETVFAGTLDLAGTSDGAVDVSISGNFPIATATITDLSELDPELNIFQVVTLEDLAFSYPYDAVVGETFSFRVTLTVAGSGVPGVGVLAVLGQPFSDASEVLELVQDEEQADKVITAVQNERANPTGEPLESAITTRVLPIGACGLFGFEAVLLVAALGGMRVTRPWCRSARRAA